MKLSVVLVSRNTCALLKQALNSLVSTCNSIDFELIIIDNASSDGSAAMVRNNFPQARLIANDTDHGVARANNQGIEQSTGEYILIVTPDTKCVKDGIEKMCEFMDEHKNTGVLGARLLSPQGRFLPESIHGLTQAWASFFKLTGFAKHLGKTRLYDKHRKDWVEEFQITEVDIVNGACMLLRRSALNQTGLFDERFFMYGQDIDLSYRLRLAGFKNYYFPKTFFIKHDDQYAHKFSWHYTRHFYGAMIQFSMKYVFKLPSIKLPGLPQLSPNA